MFVSVSMCEAARQWDTQTGNPKDKQESCRPISILIKRKASFKSEIIIDDKYSKQRMATSRLYANKPGKIVKVNLARFNEYLRKEQMPPALKAISYYFDDVHLNYANEDDNYYELTLCI